MFRRRWIWFGRLISDEGFKLSYGNRSVYYEDEVQELCFGFEDGYLFPPWLSTTGEMTSISDAERETILDRVLRGLRADGHSVEAFSQKKV